MWDPICWPCATLIPRWDGSSWLPAAYLIVVVIQAHEDQHDNQPTNILPLKHVQPLQVGRVLTWMVRAKRACFAPQHPSHPAVASPRSRLGCWPFHEPNISPELPPMPRPRASPPHPPRSLSSKAPWLVQLLLCAPLM